MGAKWFLFSCQCCLYEQKLENKTRMAILGCKQRLLNICVIAFLTFHQQETENEHSQCILEKNKKYKNRKNFKISSIISTNSSVQENF